jgi:hypothetical protein
VTVTKSITAQPPCFTQQFCYKYRNLTYYHPLPDYLAGKNRQTEFALVIVLLSAVGIAFVIRSSIVADFLCRRTRILLGTLPASMTIAVVLVERWFQKPPPFMGGTTKVRRFMLIARKRFTLALLAMSVAGSVAGAQTYYTPGYTAPPAPAYGAPAAPALTADQLDQLLGPIALYPDPLLTEILAASTYPQDIAAAQQWLQYFPTPSEDDINGQPWDPSVKAIVHYPTVLSMMASQPDWTAALGSAFANQPQDVMNSVQRLRAQAQAAGTLVNTDQQQIVSDDGSIEILPAQPDVIYVPEYDPTVVYVAHPGVFQPWITFGAPCGVGIWLDLSWDWHLHHVNEGVRWGHDWHHPVFDHPHEWHHNPARPIPPVRFVPRVAHGVEPHPENRGWDNGHPGGAFDPRLQGRPPEHPAPRAPERPVTGIPEHREPAPRVVEPIHPVEPVRPIEPVRPVEEHGDRVAAPVAPPAIHERPVVGIPHPAPEPIGRPAPAPIHYEPIRSAPSAPAFHSSGGASIQSSRGNASMGHR